MIKSNERDWEIAARACREVAELPDRDTCEHMTPDDMLVTSDELAPIIAAAAADARRQAIEECARIADRRWGVGDEIRALLKEPRK